MLTDTELGAMQDVLEESLPDTARILRKAEVDDGQGGTIDEFPARDEVPAEDTLPCRLSPIAVSRLMEAQVASRVIAEIPWVLTLPAGVTVQAEDRIEVTTNRDDPATARLFEVTGVMDPRSYQIATRLLVTEVI